MAEEKEDYLSLAVLVIQRSVLEVFLFLTQENVWGFHGRLQWFEIGSNKSVLRPVGWFSAV